MMRKTLPIICLAALIFTGSSMAADGSNQISISNLHIETTSNGLQQIQGIAKNVSNKRIKTAAIKFKLLKNNVIIGDTIDIANNVDSGESWKIQAPYNSIELKPDTFKISEIDVY